ncbi:MAG TPA: 50S ribosomal protein L30 [Thermoanaerobaculia bacterium]|jgi:large subunit ribosomal protein L30|nr:50S ribosomal protein L30 [Thermoanaerobaculia bacterium]
MSPKKAAEKTGTIRVRQVGSGIGCPREMRETLKALGLGKMNRVAERVDSKEVRGMIAKITHLVEVVE